mgnify:CR=1 FL=1|tara:strand:+ start:5696 stop:6133 length:438 start_codon:yes stop_codon:yes gene_type:complete
MSQLIIKNILPTTRIALFKGTGNREYSNEEILFHNYCVYEKKFELEPGEYAVRTIHKETFFEHVDLDLTDDITIELENSIDPTSRTITDIDSANYFIEEYTEESENIMVNENSLNDDLKTTLNELYNTIRKKYDLPTEKEFKVNL